MKIVCLSDTHGAQIEVPDGDMLLHAGDISKRGKPSEIAEFNTWLRKLPHKYKVIIAGNHDFIFEDDPVTAQSLITNAVYLNDNGIEIDGLKIWGSPISPWFHDWAFNRRRGEDIRKHWDLIPANTDILITHGPPHGMLDLTVKGTRVGCEELLLAVERIKPKIHLFGHIHEDYGIKEVAGTTFINASIMNLAYFPVNEPIIIDL
jgi:Icc-related predicted phosphoesterase